jgi:ankyrin repeat protein
LNSFDIDSCAFAFDGHDVYCSIPAHNAICNKMNIIDITKISSNYEQRLLKYSRRGYAVYIPQLDKSKINKTIFVKKPTTLFGLAKLLVLEQVGNNSKYETLRDIIDSHLLASRHISNEKVPTEYPESDYSTVSFEWKAGINADQITTKIKKKQKEINDIYNEKIDDKLPHKLCFIGTMYEVTKANDVDIPVFETEDLKRLYLKNFVAGELFWYHLIDFSRNNLIGPFNDHNINEEEWYNCAYTTSAIQKLCDAVITNDGKAITEIITKFEDKDELKKLLNSKDITFRNPIHLAFKNNNLVIAKMLLDAGTNPMCVSKLGKTVLHQICETGTVEQLELLMNYKEINYNMADSYRITPIVSTIMYSNFEVFKYLLEHELVTYNQIVWIFKYDKSLSYRALNLCLKFNRINFAKYLINSGYDINDYYYDDKKKDVHIFINTFRSYNIDMIELMKNNLHECKLFDDMKDIYAFDENNKKKYDKLITDMIRFYKYLDTTDEYLFYNILKTIRLYNSILKRDDKKFITDLLWVLVNVKDSNMCNLVVKLIDEFKIKVSDTIGLLSKTLVKDEPEKNLIIRPIDKVKEKSYKLSSNDVAYLVTMYGLAIGKKYESLFNAIIDNKLSEFKNLISDLSKVEPYLCLHKINHSVVGSIAHYKRTKMLEFVIDKIIEIYHIQSTVEGETFNIVKMDEESECEICKSNSDDEKEEETKDEKKDDSEDDEKEEKKDDSEDDEKEEKKDDSEDDEKEEKKDDSEDDEKEEKKDDSEDDSEDDEKEEKKDDSEDDSEDDEKEEKKDDSEYDEKEEYIKPKQKVVSNVKIVRINNKKVSMRDNELPADETMIDGEATNETKLKSIRPLGLPLIGHIHDVWLSNYDFTCRYILNLPYKKLQRYLMVHIIKDERLCELCNKNLSELIVKYANDNHKIERLKSNVGLYVNRILDIETFMNVKNLFSDTKIWAGIINVFGIINYKFINNASNFGIICETLKSDIQNNPDEIINIIKKYEKLEYVKVLIDMSIDLTRSNKNGENLLHVVSDPEIIKYLLENNKIDPNQQTKLKKQTPLMIAIKNGNYKCYEHLIPRTNQYLVDVFGNTVLHYASRYTSYVAFDKLEIHNIENSFNMTPFDIIVNSLKVTYHVSRLKKNEEKYHGSKIFATKIYNDFGKICLTKPRVYIGFDKTVETYNYILDKLTDKDYQSLTII